MVGFQCLQLSGPLILDVFMLKATTYYIGVFGTGCPKDIHSFTLTVSIENDVLQDFFQRLMEAVALSLVVGLVLIVSVILALVLPVLWCCGVFSCTVPGCK